MLEAQSDVLLLAKSLQKHRIVRLIILTTGVEIIKLVIKALAQKIIHLGKKNNILG